MTWTVAVGVDGSAASLLALRWALAAAAAHQGEPIAVIAKAPVAQRSAGLETSQRGLITDALTEACLDIAASTGKPVNVEVLSGSPVDVLLAVSGRVDLLVIGGRSPVSWHESVVNSLTGQLALHTRAPLCVVGAIPQPQRGRILVGYDGRGSLAAVRFAAAEAAARHATLDLVTAWHYPPDTRATSLNTATILEAGAAAAQGPIVTDLACSHPTVPVTAIVRPGYPIEVLAELAGSADMLMVGSRERTSFATVAIGSVALGLLRKLRTPVVIVPH